MRLACAGLNLPLRSISVARTLAAIWWPRSSMGYLRYFGSPNAELGSLLRVADLSFAIASYDLLRTCRRYGLHLLTGAIECPLSQHLSNLDMSVSAR